MENVIIKLSWHNVRCTTYNLVLVYLSPKAQFMLPNLLNFNNASTKKHNNNLLLLCDTYSNSRSSIFFASPPFPPFLPVSRGKYLITWLVLFFRPCPPPPTRWLLVEIFSPRHHLCFNNKSVICFYILETSLTAANKTVTKLKRLQFNKTAWVAITLNAVKCIVRLNFLWPRNRHCSVGEWNEQFWEKPERWSRLTNFGRKVWAEKSNQQSSKLISSKFIRF